MPCNPPPPPEPTEVLLTAKDLAESEQRRRYDYLLKVGSTIMLLMAVVMGPFVHPVLGLLNGIGGAGMIACLRWGLTALGTHRISTGLNFAAALICPIILANAWLTGQSHSFLMAFIPAVPLVVILISGKYLGALWVAITVATTIGMGIATSLMPINLVNNLPIAILVLIQLMQIAVFCTYGFAVRRSTEIHIDSLDRANHTLSTQKRIIEEQTAALSHGLVSVQVANQELHDSRQALKVAYERVAANEQDLMAANLQLQARELSLREAQRDLMESVGEGFIIVDRNFRILSANSAYLRLCDRIDQAVIGRHCYEVAHRFDRSCHECGEQCPARDVFATGEPQAALLKWHTAGDKIILLEVNAYPMKDEEGNVASVIELLVDVTEKVKLEEQLLQAQKMEAVGTLAGGVAHDFNNILMAIMGYSDLLKINIRPDDPQLELVDQILASANRAANLTQGLLSFSRKQIIWPKPVDLNDIVRNVDKLLARLIGEDIDFNTRLAEKELVAMADQGQIEQVLMNLAINARDAMHGGGTLTIDTREVQMKDEFISTNGLEQAGRFALITVSDTGAGMDEQTQEKIFEPFFTTKGVGHGTGLGLAIVYGIVKQHKGHINCHSEPGSGTIFEIYIPLVALDFDETRPEMKRQPRGGTETILVAEDDVHVRSMISSSLASFGYQVLDTADGQQAIDSFSEHRKEIDLVILDLVMPKKSGKEVYDIIHAERPELGILFISGYADQTINIDGICADGLEVLSKPMTAFDLHGKIRRMLDRKGSGMPEVVGDERVSSSPSIIRHEPARQNIGANNVDVSTSA